MDGQNETKTINVELKEDTIIKEGTKAFFAGYDLGKRVALASIYHATVVVSAPQKEETPVAAPSK